MDQRLLSIYIGSEVIRIVDATKKSATSMVINSVDEVATPAGSYDDGYVTDVLEIASAIRGKIVGKSSKAKAIFTISSKKIASKEIVLPFVNGEKKIRAVINANSSEYFPMTSTGDFVIAYNVMESFQDDDGKKLRINAVAAPKDLIECYYEIADELKLSVYDIDYVGNSVQQLLKLQMSANENDTNLVLQIEKDATFVNIMAGKDIILQRSVPYGKNAVINSIMEIKKLTEKEAIELLKDKDRLERNVSEAEYSEAVRYLVSSIGRIVEYHRSRNPERIIDGIKVFGEGASIAGIDDILRQELGAEVTRFNTLNGIKVSQKSYLSADQALRFLACFGAIINPIGLKISKEKDGRTVSGANITKILIGLVILAALVMISISGWYQFKYMLKKADVDFKKNQISQMEIAEKVANEYSETVNNYNIVKSFVDTTHTDNVMVLSLINDLEKKLPTGTTLDNFEAIDGVVTFDVISPHKIAVADLIEQFRTIEYMSSFEILEISVEDVDGEDLADSLLDQADNKDEYIDTTYRCKYQVTCVLVDPDFVPVVISEPEAMPELPEESEDDILGGEE